ncbi:hypothetical protein [Helicobacter fennelliae]|nr:hypothetical protein [Helicobacter fennelliae]
MSEIIGFKCDDSIIDLQSAQNPATFNANTQEQKQVKIMQTIPK